MRDGEMRPEVLRREEALDKAVERVREKARTPEGNSQREIATLLKQFIDYYTDVSASIDDDEYFELMMRNAWHISGGEGWSANTSCRRVLVIHKDGSQTVEEIKNDLGIKDTDIDVMIARLKKQGITDIDRIELYA